MKQETEKSELERIVDLERMGPAGRRRLARIEALHEDLEEL